MADFLATTRAFREQYPELMTPEWVYCIVTGKPCAMLDSHEVRDIIESLDGDPEQAADDYAMRLLASSRPSIRWNRMSPRDIHALRESHPVETLCYLLNGTAGVRADSSDFFEEMTRRIAQYNALEREPAHVIAWRFYRYFLLEDERVERLTATARHMRHWLSDSPEGRAATRSKRIAALEAEAEAIRAGKIKRPVKVVSIKTQKRRAHDEAVSMATSFMKSILGTDEPTPAPAPTPVPAKSGQAKVGFVIRIPVKES